MRRTLLSLACTLLALGGVSGTGGCVANYSHAVSASSSVQGTAVTAEDSGVGILALTAPTLDVSTPLKAACPSGKLSNVETQASMRNLVIVQLYSVEVRATCNAP